MTDATAPNPNRGRFQKGRSGNPSGRPKKAKTPAAASAFAIVIDRTLTMNRDGAQVEVRLEDALLQKAYQEAIAGKRLAIRKVLRCVEKRERWLVDNAPRAETAPSVTFSQEHDPANADEAMLILGIASHNPAGARREGKRAQLLLDRWAVEAALRRPGLRAGLARRDIDTIRHCLNEEALAALLETQEWVR